MKRSTSSETRRVEIIDWSMNSYDIVMESDWDLRQLVEQKSNVRCTAFSSRGGKPVWAGRRCNELGLAHAVSQQPSPPISMHRPTIPLYIFLLQSYFHHTTAQPWNCHAEIGSSTWDLSSYNSERTVSRTRDSAPSEFVDDVTFNLCDALKPREGYDALDQVRSSSHYPSRERPYCSSIRPFISSCIPLICTHPVVSFRHSRMSH